LINEVVKDIPVNKNVRVMFQDEGRFGRISLPRRCWAPPGTRPLCGAQIIREYIYAYSAISPSNGAIDSLIAPHANTEVMAIFLRQVAERFNDDFIIMFMDKASWHTAGKLKVPKNMKLLFLPPYSPQLNPVEHLWKEIREKYFGNVVFDNIDAVENQLMEALTFMNQNHDIVKDFSGFNWIITSL
jgi:putative transposase